MLFIMAEGMFKRVNRDREADHAYIGSWDDWWGRGALCVRRGRSYWWRAWCDVMRSPQQATER